MGKKKKKRERTCFLFSYLKSVEQKIIHYMLIWASGLLSPLWKMKESWAFKKSVLPLFYHLMDKYVRPVSISIFNLFLAIITEHILLTVQKGKSPPFSPPWTKEQILLYQALPRLALCLKTTQKVSSLQVVKVAKNTLFNQWANKNYERF